MIEQWPTEQQDMQAVKEIINKYISYSEGEAVGIINVEIHKDRKDKPVEVKPSPWVVEMVGYFRQRYGYEHGHAVISKVITTLMLKNQTIH